MAEMKEILVANLTLDTTRRNNIPPLIVPQGDYGARVIKAKITVLGKPVTVPNTASVSIVADRNGDNEALAFSGKVNEDGSVTVPVTQWMLDVPENYVTCHIEATGIDYKYSTTHFLIEPEKKANPTEITPDDPRKDVVTEVLAGEKERVLAEGIRRTNENARKSAEEARVRAEEQRLTDEATRVANEAERVSSELSRDATFKGWAQDIASLPSFDSRISANSDRITNLEAGLPSSVWHVDDTAARVKDVPENARPKAIVSKIGGMTYKSKNLFIPSKVNTTSLGITFSYFNGYVKMSGTKTSGLNTITVQTPNITLPAGTYTVSCKMVSGSITAAEGFDGVYFGINKDTYSLRSSPAVNAVGGFGKRVITLTEPTEIISFDITPGYKGEGTVFNDALFAFQFEDGDTVTTYQDGYEGLRSEKVTAVKSVGANLINVNNAVAVTGKIAVNGGSIEWTYPDTTDPVFACSFWVDMIPNTDYTISWGSVSANVVFVYTDRIFGNAVASGIRPYETFNSGNYNRLLVCFYSSNASYRTETGETISYIMLKKSSTAKPYTPYVEHILPIPEELRPANGINAEVYDSIELNENGSVKKTVKCGVMVFDGNSTVIALSDDGAYSNRYCIEFFGGMTQNSNTILSHYETDNNWATTDNRYYATPYSNGKKVRVIIMDSAIASLADFSDFLADQYAKGNPVTFVYELAEPEVTDTYADLIIDVEGGGTLTFEDEYGHDMPNTVTYMLKEVTS